MTAILGSVPTELSQIPRNAEALAPVQGRVRDTLLTLFNLYFAGQSARYYFINDDVYSALGFGVVCPILLIAHYKVRKYGDIEAISSAFRQTISSAHQNIESLRRENEQLVRVNSDLHQETEGLQKIVDKLSRSITRLDQDLEEGRGPKEQNELILAISQRLEILEADLPEEERAQTQTWLQYLGITS